MSRETGKDESISSDSAGEGEEFSIRYTAAIATFGSILVGCCITAIIISRMFDEDEIKLQVLDFLVKFLQSIARQCGAWAIECEKAYNEYVNALH